MVSNALSQATEAVQYWKTHLPGDLLVKSVGTFLSTTLAFTILTKSSEMGLSSGALSGLATLIHGAVSPLFQKIVGNRTQLMCGEELLRGSTALSTTSLVAMAFGMKNTTRSHLLGMITYAIEVHILDVSRSLRNTNAVLFLPAAITKFLS